MKRFSALLISALIALSANSAFARKKKATTIFKYSGVVERCHDGDTCRVITSSNKVLKVRFAGIDCPELSQRNGKDARDYTEGLIKGRNVNLECNGNSYDRLTCTVFLDEKNINQMIVDNGWAWDSTKYSHGRYIAAVSAAKAKRLGIWADKDLVSPYCYRHPSYRKCQTDKVYMP
ncbi:thermonuclease family protein [Bdellovibrio sp. NC01]|uniref:thermonuclease family protein n=1 Tax=Bdellovibrio sp. NC01 TaxID=2220073 RepID=UPI00143DC2FF|nr:thermonuclease family protein [Bdellovibrio sp. NC01]